MTTNSNILAQRIPWTEKPRGYSPQGCKESNTMKQLSMYAREGQCKQIPVIHNDGMF